MPQKSKSTLAKSKSRLGLLIEIDCSHAAFDDFASEVRLVLAQVSDAIEAGAAAGKLHDSNGVDVGGFRLCDLAKKH